MALRLPCVRSVTKVAVQPACSRPAAPPAPPRYADFSLAVGRFAGGKNTGLSVGVMSCPPSGRVVTACGRGSSTRLPNLGADARHLRLLVDVTRCLLPVLLAQAVDLARRPATASAVRHSDSRSSSLRRSFRCLRMAARSMTGSGCFQNFDGCRPPRRSPPTARCRRCHRGKLVLETARGKVDDD